MPSILLAVLLAWPQEPTSVLGVRFGDTEARVKAVHGKMSCKRGAVTGIRTCFAPKPDPFTSATFVFLDGRLVSIDAIAGPAEAIKLLNVYGKPTVAEVRDGRESFGWLGRRMDVMLAPKGDRWAVTFLKAHREAAP